MDKSGFSSSCKESLDDVLTQRVSDFRLDAALQVRPWGGWQGLLACSCKYQRLLAAGV
jgi:hypothetical protein